MQSLASWRNDWSVRSRFVDEEFHFARQFSHKQFGVLPKAIGSMPASAAKRINTRSLSMKFRESDSFLT